MAKLTSTMEGDKVLFNVQLDPEDPKEWCIIVASKNNYGGGFDVPAAAKILEYTFKAEKFCGEGNGQIKKSYTNPAEYIAMLEPGGKEIMSVAGPHITRFEVTGLVITDKDLQSAKELLNCMASVYAKNNEKGETVFDNFMLNPFFDTLVGLLESIINKRDIYPYVDNNSKNIVLSGPAIVEGKYMWPTIQNEKYSIKFY